MRSSAITPDLLLLPKMTLRLPRQNDTVGGYNFNAGEEADVLEASPEFDPLSGNPTDYDALTASDPTLTSWNLKEWCLRNYRWWSCTCFGIGRSLQIFDQISDPFSKMGKMNDEGFTDWNFVRNSGSVYLFLYPRV